jgi:hypothetical protein
MAALHLPEKFIARPVSEFVAGLDVVHANYWYWEREGDMKYQRPTGLSAAGARDAMLWISGQSPFPACYSSPLARTRANLLKVLRFAEMILDDEGEQVDREDGAVDIINPYGQSGARSVYQWCLGISDYLPGQDLLPEDIRAARRHYAGRRARTQDAA